MDDKLARNLAELGVEGSIGFSIKAKNNEVNIAIHEAFKEFCKYETDNNYTLGIKLLLDNWEQSNKLLYIIERIAQLEQEISQLKQKPKQKEIEENEAF